MILESPSVKDQTEREDAGVSHAALSISQLLKFNSIKSKRAQGIDTAKHSTAQKTPVPMLHAHTRKRELIDKLYHLGMSISYDCVLRISAQMGNSACEQYQREHVVCPPKLRHNVFTTSAVHNIDHNPSSTTSKKSFHVLAFPFSNIPLSMAKE